MKVKNVNPLEQHVEKIVLAVAAAAALYMGYSAYSNPTTVSGPNGQPVVADKIEETVAVAVNGLEAAIKKNRSKVISPQSEDLLKPLQVQTNPLDSGLLANVPDGVFPRHTVPGGGEVRPPGQVAKRPVAAPMVVAPASVQAKAYRAMVADFAPPAPGGAAAPAVPSAAAVPHDQQWVEVSGAFPMAQQWAQITGAGLANKDDALPQSAQRLTFYRVDVERQERHAGGWSEWASVPEPKIPILPELDLSRFDDETKMVKIKEALDLLDDKAGDIMQPPLPFQVTDGSVVMPAAEVAGNTPMPEPARPPVPPENLNRPKVLPPAPGVHTPPAGVTGRGAAGDRDQQPAFVPFTRGGAAADRDRQPPFNPAVSDRNRQPPFNPALSDRDRQPPFNPGGRPVTPSPGVDPAPVTPGQSLNAQALLSQNEVKLWFWDTTVKPGTEYRYRMRVRIYNPIYKWPQDWPVKDEPQRNTQWLPSQWVVVASSVQTQANQHYFLAQALGQTNRASVQIYQWHDGGWLKEEILVSPGQPVQTQRSIPGALAPVSMDTGCVLVDVTNDQRQNETRAVLLDASGQLTTRDTRADGNDPKRQELNNRIMNVNKPAVAPAGAPAPAAAPAVVPAARPVAPAPGGGPVRLAPAPAAPR